MVTAVAILDTKGALLEFIILHECATLHLIPHFSAKNMTVSIRNLIGRDKNVGSS